MSKTQTAQCFSWLIVSKNPSSEGHYRAKTKWGPSGKGQKTRAPKKYSNVFIVSRRKVGKK